MHLGTDLAVQPTLGRAIARRWYVVMPVLLLRPACWRKDRDGFLEQLMLILVSALRMWLTSSEELSGINVRF